MKTKSAAKAKKLKKRTIKDAPPYHGKINTKLAERTLRQIMRQRKPEAGESSAE